MLRRKGFRGTAAIIHGIEEGLLGQMYAGIFESRTEMKFRVREAMFQTRIAGRRETASQKSSPGSLCSKFGRRFITQNGLSSVAPSKLKFADVRSFDSRCIYFEAMQ